MAKQTEKGVEEIRSLLGDKRLLLGTNETLAALRHQELTTIYLCNNCKESVAKDITKYASLSQTEVITLPLSNNELGITCKKPFSISVVGIKKA